MRVLSNQKPNARQIRRSRRSLACTTLALIGAAASLAQPRDARAQGVTQRPMPNVLLLVDTSGSMERMADGSLPSDNAGSPSTPNACSPGVESNPNRWGMLIQALTGNMQPFYSCAAVSRSSGGAGAAFRNEYKINGINPYDTDYFLPYHRPLTGNGVGNACALGPHRLPGASSGSGVGPSGLGYSTGLGSVVTDFPDDTLLSAKYSYLQTQYGSNAPLASPLGASDSCVFDQALDGQLDAARDYVRFGLMTFDNDESAGIGVNGGTWPPAGQINAASPFLGQWTYIRDSANGGISQGYPAGCDPSLIATLEVGARHWGAPPWEGRMVPFPADDASLLDIQRTNERIQKVLLATRPYGATPIDGMLEDARDYFWFNAIGPKTDPYVATAMCREQFIILLTDGAPNLNMRPACQGGGLCPFKRGYETARELYDDSTRKVTTFVIGFSVNGANGLGGDGFPATYTTAAQKTCKYWYYDAAPTGGGGTPKGMFDACAANPSATAGTTAEACCELNRIAYEGTGGSTTTSVGPFFAESQADIVLSFGRILATITKAVSTRTTPTYTPSVYKAAGFNTGAMTAQFLGSFIPNAQKPWSGEIRRDRSVCGNDASSGGAFKPIVQTPSLTAGDSMAVNLAAQSAANRLFVTALPETYTEGGTTYIDASRSVRPFAGTSPTDGIGGYRASEEADKDWNLKGVTNMQLALQIDRNTCKRGRTAGTGAGSATIEIPALDNATTGATDCTDVVMGFATAHVGAITKTGRITGGATASYDFNIRCGSSTATPSAGKCSISDVACDVANPTACNTIPGQVCVPDCAPLGAIFRANPVVNGPPDGLLRDAGYRAFQARRINRKPALFAVTTDGILHAFKAMETTADAHHELWSFIPPAILPRLASNYPSGNQILLDGTPVVKDTVWERGLGDLDTGGSTSPGAKWHTTLVAGLGANGGGYYAVNVTDSDCNSAVTSTTGECATPTGAAGYQKPTAYNLDEAGAGDYDAAGTPAKRGPHFLWQLTDVRKASATDPARVVRRTPDGKDMVSLFGRNTSTPAITTLQVKLSGVDRQVGVAILPGGVDGTPVEGGSCSRIAATADLAHDATVGYRTSVRQWAPSCSTASNAITAANSAVPGRGVTIVRLDTGAILRHFGRRDDVPESIWNAGVVNASPFDSPIVGTPVVYPQTTGAIAQKIFVGDADGTIWRIDVSSTNPADWKVTLFADLVPSSEGAAGSQPVQIAPVLSLEPSGSLVLNAATGDQESVVFRTGEKNYVWSILETRPTSSAGPRAKVNWRETLTDGERVTGPMTVFDRTLYFASFAPKIPVAGACGDAGVARLWGLDYLVADSGTPPGGSPRWCGSVSALGVCTSGSLTKYENVTGDAAGAMIPGVTLRPSQACSEIADLGEGTGTGFQTLTSSQFMLSYGVSKQGGATTGFPPTAMTESKVRPLPRVATTVNAWALVVD